MVPIRKLSIATMGILMKLLQKGDPIQSIANDIIVFSPILGIVIWGGCLSRTD